MNNRGPPEAINRSAQGTIDARHGQRYRKQEKFEDKRYRSNAKFENKMADKEFKRQPYSEYNQRQLVVTKTKKDAWDKVGAVGGLVQGVGATLGGVAALAA